MHVVFIDRDTRTHRYTAILLSPMGSFSLHMIYEERFFYVRRKVDLMKTEKVDACIMHTFGKIELLSIHTA